MRKKQKDVSKEKLLNVYVKEREMEATEFLEWVKNHPSPENVLRQNICGEVIDLSDYEHFQVNEASPFDFDTLTAYNTAYVYKEALHYSPAKAIKNYGWLIYLLMAAIAIPVGIVILKQVI